MADDDGWRVLEGVRTAWFDAPDLVAAAALARRVLEQVPQAAVDVRASGIRVRLDADPALDLGPADPSALQQLDIVLETADPGPVSDFWARVLGRDSGPDLLDTWRRDPALHVRRSTEHRPLRNRIHLDVVRPEAVVGGLGLGEASGPYGVRHADPEGNEVDVVPGGSLGHGAGDWQAVFSAMACYRTEVPEQLAEVVAELAGDLPLGIDLRPGAVVLDSGKDQWEDGVVAPAADVLAVAARIQASARELGAVPDVAAPRFLQLFLDAADVPAVQHFWTAALGYVTDPRPGLTDIHDPRRLGPVLVFQPLDPAEEDRRHQRNRLHLVLTVPEDAVGARLDAALAAGGRLLADDRVADPEGSELIIAGG